MPRLLPYKSVLLYSRNSLSQLRSPNHNFKRFYRSDTLANRYIREILHLSRWIVYLKAWCHDFCYVGPFSYIQGIVCHRCDQPTKFLKDFTGEKSQLTAYIRDILQLRRSTVYLTLSLVQLFLLYVQKMVRQFGKNRPNSVSHLESAILIFLILTLDS